MKEDSLEELLGKTRSIRKFRHETKIPAETLEELVELTRLCPSGGNRQPLKFLPVNTEEDCRFVSEHIRWAALLKDWDGPEESEKPSAYVLVLIDRTVCEKAPYDSGIAAHAMLLGAVERGFAGCMLGNIDRDALAEYFSIDKKRYVTDLVVALGEPGEESVVEETGTGTAYYRDEEGLFHVPKRKLSEILLKAGSRDRAKA